VVDFGGVRIGDGSLAVFAGPCAVENSAHLRATGFGVRARGAVVLRGGAYKPRTSPHAFQGMATEGLRLLAECSRSTGLPVVTEGRGDAAASPALRPGGAGRHSQCPELLATAGDRRQRRAGTAQARVWLHCGRVAARG
jgi:hypothetical protein